MIDLRLEAETPAELIAQIMALAAGFATGGPVSAAEPAAPKPPGRGKKGTAEATAGAVGDISASGQAGSPSTAGTGDAGQGSSETGTSAAGGSSTGNSLDKDALAARCTAYGQKAGREALKQLFIVLGAPDGKWTQVPADKYPALDQSLTDFGF